MVKSGILIATPELVNSWIFHPAWLSISGFIPRFILMDFTDLKRSKDEAKSINANPYDVILWETIKLYMNRGFLVAHDPMFGKAFEKGSLPFKYEKYIKPTDKSEFDKITKRIIKKLGNEEKEKIVLDGYKNWKLFGLEMKQYFKGNDPLFKNAIDITIKEISQIERGVIPIEPDLLIKRYLKKLLTALEIRKVYSKLSRMDVSNFRIFDTPEYIPAAKLLRKELDLSPYSFAIPSQTPLKNEQIIREILKLDDSSNPICSVDMDLFYQSIKYIRDELDNGISEVEIKREIESKLSEAQIKVSKTEIAISLGLLGVNVPVWNQIIKAITGDTVNDISPFIISIISICAVIISSNDALKYSISDYPSPVQFIINKDIINNFNPLLNIKHKWISQMLKFARKFKPRPITEERISRQMMEPWVKSSVWYD